MPESGQGSGRRAFGNLTNVLGKRLAPISDLKNVGGSKVSRVEKALDSSERFDGNANACGGATGSVFGDVFDGAAKENFVRPSIFHDAKVQHMAAEAAGQLSKEVSELRNHRVPLDSSELNDKEQEFSLESEGDCEEEEDDDEIDSELLAYSGESSMGHFGSLELVTKMASKDKADDGECLTQEHMMGSSGNQKSLFSLDFTMGGGMPSSNSNLQHAPMGNGGLEDEADAVKSCACSFCLKAAFMWTDLHYQDARGRLAALKKSRKIARLLEAKVPGNEYTVDAARHNSKQAVEMESELAQQQRSLFLRTENILVRETAQLHSKLVKLKELRDNCQRDLQVTINSSLEK